MQVRVNRLLILSARKAAAIVARRSFPGTSRTAAAFAATLLFALSLFSFGTSAAAAAAAGDGGGSSDSAGVRLLVLDIDHDGDLDLLAFPEDRADRPAAIWLNDGRGGFQRAAFRSIGPEDGSAAAAAAVRPVEFTFSSLLAAPQTEEYTPTYSAVRAGDTFLYRGTLLVRGGPFSAPYWVLPRHLVSPLSRRGPPSLAPTFLLYYS